MGFSSPSRSVRNAQGTMAGSEDSYVGAPATPKQPTPEDRVDWVQLPLNAALDKLHSTRDGLTTPEADARFARYGPNELPEEKLHPIWVFLRFMWNPLSWAMEVAAVLAIILQDYADFGLILFLLLLNALIGFYEELQAGDAVAALRSQLTPESFVRRDGVLQKLPANVLVPGDIVHVRLGDVISADVKFLEGDDVVVDQSSITGESLPIAKGEGDVGYSGSIVKLGELDAVVTGTGRNTFLGRAASQVSSTEPHGRLQSVLTAVGNFCLVSILIWCVVELIVQMGVRGHQNACYFASYGCQGVANILVLIVGGIPVAMPTVLSVTLAIGSAALARENAIVTRLTCIEELASMEILCCDKTGTLTLNQLSVDLDHVKPADNFSVDDVLKFAALSSRSDNGDVIDAVCARSYLHTESLHETYEQLQFTPFDPKIKRTMVKVRDLRSDKVFYASKGAPQAILSLLGDENAAITRQVANDQVNEIAAHGYRSLAVAVAHSGDVPVANCRWEFVGVLALYDPPRPDTAETIQRALDLGVLIKMVTGDQRAIAVETCRQLGLPTNILDTSILETAPRPGVDLPQLIYDTDGFAQVFPEHKFEIVKHLQKLHKVVGMTGDGVNDAPALAQADIGIAVDDATEAARAAADIVLVSPGLSVIISAIRQSREIFLRMKNYAMYSIAMTVRVVFTFGILTVAWNWYFPTLLVVILAILNDGTILTIATDNVRASPVPDAWKLREVFVNALCFGLWLTLSTVIFFAVVRDTTGFAPLGVENLCVECQYTPCEAFFEQRHQMCTKRQNATRCGEMDGTVSNQADVPAIGTFRARAVDQYWDQVAENSRENLFEDLDEVRLNYLPHSSPHRPNVNDEYDQFLYQFTLGHAGKPFDSTKYDAFGAAQDGEGVAFIGMDRVPVTNEVGFCSYLWHFRNFNSTWTRNHETLGPGAQRKSAILRALVYAQVSISGQALIFVTRTVGSKVWCIPSWPGRLLVAAFFVAQIVASAIGWVGFAGYPPGRSAVIGCGGYYILIAWIWVLLWHFPLHLIQYLVNFVLTSIGTTYTRAAFNVRRQPAVVDRRSMQSLPASPYPSPPARSARSRGSNVSQKDRIEGGS